MPKKYTLFTDKSKPCAFFQSPEGCRNGDKCPWPHISVEEAKRMAEVKPVEAVSPLPPEPKKAAKKKKKAKEKAKPSPAPVHTSSSSSFPPSASLSMPASLPSAFVPSALPVQAFAQTPTALPLPMNPLSPPTSGASNKRKGDHDSSGKKGKKRKTDHKSPGFVLTPSQPGMEKQAKSTERTAPVQKSPVAPLPMASLNIAALPFTPAPTTQQQRKKSSNKKKKQNQEQVAPSPQAPALFANLPIVSFNSSTPSAQGATPVTPQRAPPPAPPQEPWTWEGLVQRTQAHPRFRTDYDFTPHFDSNWVSAPAIAAPGVPKVLALDCEMCVSQDPMSGEKNAKELVRLSVVTGDQGESVLLDSLVKPNLPIADMVTRIHGIKENDLNGVYFNIRHAQAALSQLCGQDTILVGHALHNDLISLKFYHTRVIDTSCIFQRANGKTCSLKDLCERILETKQQEPHDSVCDAQMALLAARSLLGTTDAPTLVDGPSTGGKAKRHEEKNSMLVHRLPKGVSETDIKSLFVNSCFVLPLHIEKVSFNGETGKCRVEFKSKEHCDLAFTHLPGKVEEDSANFESKRIFLEPAVEGGRRRHFKIRKME